MTIDEAIKAYEYSAKFTWNGKPTATAEECQKMVEWLKDYKRLLGAIDDIKEELESAKYLNYGQQYYLVSGLNKALEIIEKHISGKEQE